MYVGHVLRHAARAVRPRPVPPSPPPPPVSGDFALLLTDDRLTATSAKVSGDTAQWQAFKARLDANLEDPVSLGSYQGSWLSWGTDYALGYALLKGSDQATAYDYADKAISILRNSLTVYQKGQWITQRYVARGDGSTTTFALPHPASEVYASGLKVYTAPIYTQSIVRGAGESDSADFYNHFLKISNTNDGPADYTQDVHWERDGTLHNNQVKWISGGPAQGNTYYVTHVSLISSVPVSFTLVGDDVVLDEAPAADRGVLVEYVHGKTRSLPDTLKYQSTSAYPDGGVNSVYIDAGYASRYLGKHVSTILDWLDDYPGMTTALKAETADMLRAWYDWWRANGYLRDYPTSNYGTGGYASQAFTAVALAGRGYAQADVAGGGTILDQMATYRDDRGPLVWETAPPAALPAGGSFKGGYWSEGWSYGPLATRNMLLAGVALEGAGAIPDSAEERAWATEVVTSLVHLQPTQATVYDGGDWFAWPAPFPSKEMFTILSEVADTSDARSWAQQILDTYAGSLPADWEDLLFRDPDAASADWTSTLPLSHFHQGSGLAVARGDWSYGSTFVTMEAGNLASADHQSYAHSFVRLLRGGDDLMINAPVYANEQSGPPKTHRANLLQFDSGGAAQNYTWSQGVWLGSPGVSFPKVETSGASGAGSWVYWSCDYKAAWSKNDDAGGGGPISMGWRSVLFVRPDIVVVHDRATKKVSTYDTRLQWCCVAAPATSGGTFTVTQGSSKCFGTVLSPAAFTLTATEITDDPPNYYALRSVPDVDDTKVRFTTVLQTAASGVSSGYGATRVATAGDGRLEGAFVDGRLVALFGDFPGPVDTTGGVSYSYTAANGQAVTHVVCDLTPDQTYTLSGAASGTPTASADGVIEFTTTGSGSGQTVTIT